MFSNRSKYGVRGPRQYNAYQVPDDSSNGRFDSADLTTNLSCSITIPTQSVVDARSGCTGRIKKTDVALTPESILDTAAEALRTLSLINLGDGSPGVTQAWGSGLAEAGAVCLEEQGHDDRVELPVNGEFSTSFSLVRAAVTPQMKDCWHDEQVTTEHGAYGIAILLMRRLADQTVLKRSRKGTGFDFWMGTRSDPRLIFNETSRLEVSGLRNATVSEIAGRLSEKIEQTKKSDGILPAYVVVVEFSRPISHLVKR